MSMCSDYTINDAFHDGFVDGLLYILRYLEQCDVSKLTDGDIYRLSVHLAEKKPWRNVNSWQELINSNIRRWRRDGA